MQREKECRERESDTKGRDRIGRTEIKRERDTPNGGRHVDKRDGERNRKHTEREGEREED